MRDASASARRSDAWIIEADGEPVGYLQSWWEPDEPRRGGLDGFLVPAARGRGLMPDAARALAQSLLDAGWQYVTVDPYAWNERASAAGRTPASSRSRGTRRTTSTSSRGC